LLIDKSTLNTVINDPITGKALFDARGTWTVRRILYDAINTMTQEDQDPSKRDARFKLGELSMRIANAPDGITINLEEASTLKERVSMVWSPAIVFQTHEILEKLAGSAKADPKEEKKE